MKEIFFSGKTIRNYSAPYVIAEIGANHNGEMNLAKKMIDKAVDCGANAVKFQSWTPESLIAREEYDRYQEFNDGDGGKKHFGSLREMVEKYYLREEEHYELKKYCDNKGVNFCSTPFSIEEVDLLMKLDVPFIKVASMDINNLYLLHYIAKQGKPILLSTGMATLGEIDQAIRTIESEGNNQIVILHCISVYPPEDEDIHLNNIPMLQRAYDYPVGFSDHSIGAEVPLAAIALGSSVIEKHFTLDKDMPGWDHAVSANPEELKLIIQGGKKVNGALGNYFRTVSQAEEKKKLSFRRSIVSAKGLKKGEIIKSDDITYKRPARGIAPDLDKFVIGRQVSRDIEADELIKWEDLE